jgi:glutathione S-transferase
VLGTLTLTDLDVTDSAPYQYREVDPYKKPADLLELNPKGLVPALKLSNGKGLAESTVM